MMKRVYKYFLLLFTTLQTFSNGEELTGGTECYEDNNCTESIGCISQYRDLQSYILHNHEILDKLTEAFFTTGQGVSNFVRITYNSHISNLSNYTKDDIIVNCISRQSLYIWSESPLYLLGPTPLFWFSLFAINVPETSVEIDIPCLCRDTYDGLLSRLTYLVSKLL